MARTFSLICELDLHKAVLSSKVTCFADDTKVLKIVKGQQDSVDLQSDIDNLMQTSGCTQCVDVQCLEMLLLKQELRGWIWNPGK
jgi:hypothetical protein